jgi:hypothetical protein
MNVQLYLTLLPFGQGTRGEYMLGETVRSRLFPAATYQFAGWGLIPWWRQELFTCACRSSQKVTVRGFLYAQHSYAGSVVASPRGYAVRVTVDT